MALKFSEAEFRRVRQRAWEEYRVLGPVRCPYLRMTVAFNTEGFRHLLFKSWNRGRDQHDQFMRLKHVIRAAQILQLSHTVQGIKETTEWERQHRHGRWEQRLVQVTYFEFVAVLEYRRFKVIVKRLPDGQHIFWSLIPFWYQSQYGKRLLHDGNPADD